MSGLLPYVLAGEDVVLDGARALYWPRTRTLLVADVHFGKSQVLRGAGIGVPRGSTSGDLARLDAALARHGATRLVVLGDFVHGRSGLHDEWLARVREWRARHDGIAMLVVLGNHDRHFDPRLAGFDVAQGVVLEPPFAWSHYARPCPGHYTLAGHVHPGIEMRDLGARERLPVFCFGAEAGILPAFGRMTGLAMIEPEPDDRLVAVVGDELLPLRARAFSRAPGP